MILQWLAFLFFFILPIIGIIIYLVRVKKGKEKPPYTDGSWLDVSDIFDY
jgi:hypothetical protein